MALEEKKYLDQNGVKKLVEGISTWVESENSEILKSVRYEDNVIYFYDKRTATSEDSPAFTVDLPKEIYLDQTKTTLVNNFTWSEELYPNSVNPNLDGQPVLVLAVKNLKGAEDAITEGDVTYTYSFISMNNLLNIYTADNTKKSVALTINPDTYVISAEVVLSEKEGNILSFDENGKLFADKDVSNKADKLTEEAVLANQILVDDGTGNLAGSGVTIQNIVDSMVPYTAEEVQSIVDSVLGPVTTE